MSIYDLTINCGSHNQVVDVLRSAGLGLGAIVHECRRIAKTGCVRAGLYSAAADAAKRNKNSPQECAATGGA